MTSLLDDELRRRLPPLDSDPGPLSRAVAQTRFYALGGPWRWYPLRYDGQNVFFGIVVLGEQALLGEFTLQELEAIQEEGGPGVIRDSEFQPLPVARLARIEPAVARLLEDEDQDLIPLE